MTVSSSENLVDIPIETIQKEIGTNILGNFYTIKTFLPGMQKLNRGHIVTVSSALGFMGPAKLCTSHLFIINTSNLFNFESSLTIPP